MEEKRLAAEEGREMAETAAQKELAEIGAVPMAEVQEGDPAEALAAALAGSGSAAHSRAHLCTRSRPMQTTGRAD